MKVTGTIILQQTPPRTDAWVTKKMDKDYFLALEITQIGEHKISTLESAYKALKPTFPSVKIADKEFIDEFTPAKPVVKDVVHIALGNFGDFRKGRNVANDFDEDAIAHAEDLHKTEFSFEINDTDFQLVSTSDLYKTIQTTADLAYTKSMYGRDGVISLFPGKEIQEKLSKFSESVFGEGFKLWDASKNPIPYNITVAQTTKLSAALELTRPAKEVEKSATLSIV